MAATTSGPTPLDGPAIDSRLQAIPGWQVKNGKLHREFSFDDFVGAFSFMTAVALIAEKLNHHPDWSNAWNRVTIDLMTHDAGGITDRDFLLATRISMASFHGQRMNPPVRG
jgi:4a-hydroxytetrahydrobiopterin dehydratase